MAGLAIPDALLSSTTLSTISWQPLSACAYADTVAVFRFQLSGNIDSDHHYPELQAHEISHAQRYHRKEDRTRYIYTRRILRILLGRYVNQKPSEIYFTAGINKKPELKDNTDWCMNVSHSGDWVVVAIAKTGVGIDTEWVNPDFTFWDMLPQSFSQQEQHYIEASSNSRLAFFDLWTRKESLVKATAKGLDDDFAQIPSLDGTHAVESKLIGSTGHWMVTGFTVFESYPAAVAYRPMDEMPKFYTLDSGLFGRSES